MMGSDANTTPGTAASLRSGVGKSDASPGLAQQIPDHLQAPIPVFARLRDTGPLYDWLRARHFKWRHALAGRAALRVLPLGLSSRPTPKDATIALAMFRATSVSRFSGLAIDDFTEVDRENLVLVLPASAAAAATAAAGLVPSIANRAAVRATADAADAVSYYTASLSASSGVGAATEAIRRAIVGGGLLPLARAIEADAEALQSGILPDELLRVPLWDESVRTDAAQQIWQSTRDVLLKLGAHWEVWVEWYQHVFEGSLWEDLWEKAFTDLPGPLRWDDGADAVNLEIATRLIKLRPSLASRNGPIQPIVTDFQPEPAETALKPSANRSAIADDQQNHAALYREMQSRLLVLENLIAELKGQSARIGHNNPPDPIEGIAFGDDDRRAIDQAIAVLKAQTLVPAKRSEARKAEARLRAIGERLWTDLSRAGAYAAKQADIFISEMVKAGGAEVGKRLAQVPFWWILAATLMALAASVSSWLGSLH
jgi:hypothetical protein